MFGRLSSTALASGRVVPCVGLSTGHREDITEFAPLTLITSRKTRLAGSEGARRISLARVRWQTESGPYGPCSLALPTRVRRYAKDAWTRRVWPTSACPGADRGSTLQVVSVVVWESSQSLSPELLGDEIDQDYAGAGRCRADAPEQDHDGEQLHQEPDGLEPTALHASPAWSASPRTCSGR